MNDLNTKKYAEEIYQEGLKNDNLQQQLILLGIYARDFLGYKPKQREELLRTVYKKDEQINENIYYKIIDRALKVSKDKKQKLLEIDYIPIYEKELKLIEELKINEDYKKCLFGLITLNRLKNIKIKNKGNENLYPLTYNYINIKETKFKKICDIKKSYNLFSTIFFELKDLGIIDIVNHGLYLKLLENIEEDNKVAIEIEDVNSIGLYYSKYHGDNKICYCSKCGKLFRKKSNNQLKCNECTKKAQIDFKVTNCKDCGKELLYITDKPLRCEECSVKRHREINREWYNKNKKNKNSD